MADLIDLDEHRPHAAGMAHCLACAHAWVAVAPTGVVWLECPACHAVKGLMDMPYERVNEPHWTCDCGNQLFYATLNGMYCPNCGEQQHDF